MIDSKGERLEGKIRYIGLRSNIIGIDHQLMNRTYYEGNQER